MASDNPRKRRKVSGEECSGNPSANFGLRKHGNSKKSAVASKFMSIVSDDLWVEILLRLPNARCVLQYTVVCKRWYSLILSPEFSFRRRFIEYHHLLKPSSDPSYRPDHTFAFFFKFSASESDPSYQLSSDSILKPKLYWPSFIPSSATLAIGASSDDLMLLSEGNRRFYICNSLTRRWFLLPEIPPVRDFAGHFRAATFALVRYPSNTDPQLLGRYRVVVLCGTQFVVAKFRCTVVIFDSETGLWTQSYPCAPFSYPRLEYYLDIDLELAIASNGVLYWMDGIKGSYHGMASLDPSTLELCVNPLPAGQFRGLRSIKFKHKVRTGVVRGRVRVSRMVEFESKDRFGLRVWELNCGDDTWELVHDIELQVARASFLFLLAFDPNDGDAIFVVRDWKIFRYEIGRQKFVEVCMFPRDGILSRIKLKETICRYLKVLPLVHPLWPTSMPSGSE